VSWEIDQLKDELASAQRGERFLLQGGDCAESFADCDSDTIARKLKILLQMSVVLLHGLKKPVIRVGRIAGQFAKPRSAESETQNGVTLPSYRGDLVNRAAFTALDREADPELLLRGYERAALTLNFVRALVDGGFADMHHPEYWDLGFLQHAKLRDAYTPGSSDLHLVLILIELLCGDLRDRPCIEALSAVRVFTHATRVLADLLYEQKPQTRILKRRQALGTRPVDPHALGIGLSHQRPEAGAHVEYLPRHCETRYAVKVGEGTDAATARAKLWANPPSGGYESPGAPDKLIHRFGATRI
jgi:3-deoxy-7-phosphoheptulonate synthase